MNAPSDDDSRRTIPAPPVVGVYHPAAHEFVHLLAPRVSSDTLRLCSAPDGLHGIIDDVDVLLACRFRGAPFPRDWILASPRLQWVQLTSAGVDHILPLSGARCVVTNASGLHGPLVAEYVMAVVLQWSWDSRRLEHHQREHEWAYRPSTLLAGRTLGVLGAGHVGQTVAERALAFGMRVIGTRRTGRATAGFDRVYGPDGTGAVLEAADVTVVSLPLTSATRQLVGSELLARARPHARLVVVSRGGIVDEDALADALLHGRLAGAAIDVFAQEPLPPSSRLWDAPNLIVTPHVSGARQDSTAAVARLFARNLDRFTRGQALENVVNPSVGY